MTTVKEARGKRDTSAASAPADRPDAADDLKSLPIGEVEKRLGSSPAGLTQTEAQTRLVKYGPNEIEEHKTNPLLKFLTYFWGPIPWMIEGAVALSAAARHWPDFFIILVLLVSNALVGFWEERQAGNAIEALDWSCRLQVSHSISRPPACVGIRAHHIGFVGSSGAAPPQENIFPCWLVRSSETPFRMTLYLRLNQSSTDSSEFHLQAEVFKEKWNTFRDRPQPWHVHLTPDSLFLMPE